MAWCTPPMTWIMPEDEAGIGLKLIQSQKGISIVGLAHHGAAYRSGMVHVGVSLLMF